MPAARGKPNRLSEVQRREALQAAERKRREKRREIGRQKQKIIRLNPEDALREADENIVPVAEDEVVYNSIDIPFLVCTLIILAFGLIMLYSSSYASAIEKFGDSTHFIVREAVFAAIGIAGMLVMAYTNYHVLRRLAVPLLIVSVILLVLVLLIGRSVNEAKRWITIYGDQGFQPSEVAKLGVVVFFAYYISKFQDRMKTFKYGIAPFFVILGLMGGLLLLEPHISATIIIAMTGLMMIFVGGAPVKFLAGIAGIGAAGISYFIFFTQYAKDRIDLWLNPYLDPGDKGYQIIQSLIAIGSGGLFGLGLGKSRQKFLYIPEPHNDFIFAIVCEELGFVGALLVIALFAFLILRGYWIAIHARDKFGCLLAFGVTTLIAIQTVLNIAVVTKLIPVTGISLPFFSYGGTSLAMLLFEMGIILSVSRQIPAPVQG